MLELVGMVVAAVVAAGGAIASAAYAANARNWSRDVERLETQFTDRERERTKSLNRLENETTERERERLKAEGEVWNRFAKLSDSYVPRREFEIYVELMRDLKGEVREIESQLAGHTERILHAVNSIKPQGPTE